MTQAATSQQETRTGLFIAGESREAADTIPVFDPADPETVVGHAGAASADQAREAVRAADAAFPGWVALGRQRRAELVGASLGALPEGEEERIELLSRENGKVRMECEIEMKSMAGRFELAVERADALDAVRTLDAPPFRTEVSRLPLGVVSFIVPFNWPLAILAASLPQALVAGNTAVVKAPPTTPLAFVQTVERIAGELPPGVLNVISGRDEEIGPVLVQDPSVKMVAFTGSVPGGKRIMAMAAENLTRVLLELGGNDPAILLSDAEIDADAVQRLSMGAFLTTGQVCMAMKRLYVHRSRYDEVVDGLSEALAATRVGRGLDPDANMGPLHTGRQRDFVAELVSEVRGGGAEVREFGETTGGSELDRGHFLRPVLVLDPPADARIVTEEQFGPALPIIPFDSEEDVVRQANDTWAGLCSSVWSADPERAASVAARLRSGTTFINAHSAPFLDNRAPFGGFNQSGIGRELGAEGFLTFTDTHSVSTPA
ncbi:MAG TPA: aldehyde dehydrogenase family protein [Thermoleophilaceae bacterium]|nr:aldehyde dehydrogenase family protein [Thermoleophilaceae bacterium]